MSETNFAAIGQLVTEAKNLLDSIKGGAIRVMQTQFDALKVQLNDVINGADGRLNSFITQQKQNVSTIFTDPDKRYQTKLIGTENEVPLDLMHLDSSQFYCVVFDHAEMLDVRIKRYINEAGESSGILDYYLQLQNWSNGGDFTFCKHFHHYYFGVPFVGKVAAALSAYESGIWLRGGYKYRVFTSGRLDSDIRVVESNIVTEVDASVPESGFILGQ